MKPILFSTAMVQAVMAGQKTMTRRVAKGIPLKWIEEDGFSPAFVGDPENGLAPYQPGDTLWVRETWTTDPHGVDLAAIANSTMPVYYKADYSERDSKELFAGVWRPSIHMPREAARLFLHVTDVRVERLQDISTDDALAEGITLWPEAYNDPDDAYWQAIRYFSALWDGLNAKRGYGWDANPWVWVISFERISKEEATHE